MDGGLPVARIAGIEVRISLAWVFLLALVTLLGAQQAAAEAPALPAVVEWVIGTVVAVAFLVTVLAHELGHAVVARRRGIEVRSIVLGFLGGTAPFDMAGRTPRDELAIAASGPVISLGLGAVLTAAGRLASDLDGLAAAIGGGVFVVGVLNLVLGALSLIPGMPLDGGRLIRAVLWSRTGDPRQGTRLGAVIGRGSGWMLVGIGVFVALSIGPAEGLMLLSLGWLVASGASAVERRLALETLLDGVVVAEVMDREVAGIGPGLTLDTFADRYLGTAEADQSTSLPVVAGDEVVGVVGLDRIRRISRRRWPTTRAADVMARPPAAPHLAPDDPLWDALEVLRRSGVDGLPVVDGGTLAGVLTRRGAATAIRQRLAARAGGAR